MSIFKQSARGLLWVFLEGAGRQVISLVVLAVLVRVLAPADFGLFAMAAASVRLANLMQASGFTSALIQKETIDAEHLDTAFIANMLISCVLAVGLWFSADLVAWFFQEPSVAEIVRWMAVTPILAGLSQVQTQVLSRRMQFSSLARRTLVAGPISGVLAVVAAVVGWGVWSLVIRVLSQHALTAVICWGASSWRPALRFSTRHARELFSFGASMMGANFIGFLRKEGATMIIGRALGATELGYYSMAVRICDLLKDTFVSGVGRVSYSMFSRLQHDPSMLRSAYLRAIRFSCVVTFPVFVGLALIAPTGVPLVLGPAWVPAIAVLQILAMQALIESIASHTPTLLAASGRPELRMQATGISAFSGLLLALLVSRFGIEAVAGAYLLESILMASVSWVFLQRLRQLELLDVWNAARAAFLAVLVMAGGLLAVELVFASLPGFQHSAPLNGWFQSGITIVMGAALYGGVLLWMDPGILSDVRRASQAFRESK
jgi:O-antigen/teichoic acid export membrane protein